MKKKLVGIFNENDLKEGKDVIAIEKAKDRTGLQYTESKYIKKGGKIVGLKVWVADDFTI